MADALPWEDDTGRRRWQPTIDGDYRACVVDDFIRWKQAAGLKPLHRPALYRSRAKAIRIARREERRRARNRWTPVREETT